MINIMDAAKELNVDRETLKNWYKKGKINIIDNGYGNKFISKTDFEKMKEIKMKEKSKYCKICFSEDGPFCEDRWQCLECYRKYQQSMRLKHIDKRKAYNKTEKRMAKNLERANKFYEDNTEKVLKIRKEYFDKNSDLILLRNRLNKYNITEKEYNDLLEKSNGKCEICGIKPKRECIDHCHESGKIRGILCNNCNRALGFFKDDVNILKSAINYLSRVEKSISKNSSICLRLEKSTGKEGVSIQAINAW